MKWRAVLIIQILLSAVGCDGGGLGNPASRDGGLGAEVGPDLVASSPDAPVYRQSTQPFVGVSAGGGDETCGLKSGGSMLCWGNFGDFPISNAFGEAYVPRPHSEGWKQVSPAAGFACGIKNDDTLVCWGNSGFGNMQPPSGTYMTIDARGPCGLGLSDGRIICWGVAQDWANPVPTGSFRALSIGDGVGCGLRTDGTAVCWGNSRSMAAMGTTPDGAFLQVAQGGLFSCGLRGDGQVVCWGAIVDWASTDAREAPQPQGTFVQIAAGADAACGVRTDGTLACWGAVWGLLPPAGSYRQVSVGSSDDVISVYFCAIRADGIVVCWGGNHAGESSPP
jgi:hypothetical protein